MKKIAVSLTDHPEQVQPNVLQGWEEKSAKAKNIIILRLGDALMAKTRAIVDDDEKSAKELSEELDRLYTTSNHHAITNIINCLNWLVFDEKKECWNKFLSKFMSIIYKLRYYDKEITDEEKKKKLLRTLPQSFKPIAMVCNVTKMSLNDFVDAMNAKIERQQKVDNRSTSGHHFQSTPPQA